MSPPGRRKFSTFSSILFLFLALTHTASAAASLIGIDLGTSYLKAVLVKPGIPLEIVLSKDSKRKESAAVAFKPLKSGPLPVGEFPERAYGPDALALAARFPGDVYPNLKPLLGKLAEGSNELSEYSKAHPAIRLHAAEGRGTVGFKSGSFVDAEREWSVEELLAMELKNLRQNAEAMAKGKVNYAVITVPTFYTARERRAVEVAADLAGLDVMAIISDGLAVGMNYAMTRVLKPVGKGGEVEHHMVFDMGAGSTTATIIKFQAKEVKDIGKFNRTIHELTILGTGWDKTLGGDALNLVVYEDMVEKFLQSPDGKKLGIEASAVKGHGRATAKLLKDSERVRQVLSANTDTSASFESLYDDADFRYKLSRAEFEKLAAPLAARLEKPVQAALDAAKLTFKDLNSVIMHGGTSRTPFVQKALEKLAGDASKLRSNVNADEAAVFGAAFKGASLSPQFRVKEIWDSDTGSYPVNIKWTYDGKEKKQKVFTPTSLVGATPKQVPFKNQEDFEITFSQQVPSLADSSVLEDAPVLVVETKNLTASVEKLEKLGCPKNTIDTVFAFRLDPTNGLPEVVGGAVSCEIEEPEKKGTIADGVKGLFGFGGKKDQDPLKDEASSNSETTEGSSTATEADTATSASASSSTDAKGTDAAKKEEKPAPPKKRLETIPIKIKATQLGFEHPSAEELTRIQKRLAAFDAADEARRDREETLNTLEAYVYRARDLLSQEDFTEYMKPDEVTTAQGLTDSTGEWLSSDGNSADVKVLKEKLKALKTALDPVAIRKKEFQTRPDAIKALEETFNRTLNLKAAMQKEVDELAEAAASKSASEAEASASSASAAAAAAATESENLDADDASSTTSTSSAKPTPTSSYTDDYTSSDVFVLGVAYDNTKQWYDEKKEEQEKLTKFDDPAILTADIEQRTTELNDLMWQYIQKKIKFGPDGKQEKKTKATKKAKKTKTKTAVKAKSTAKGAKGAAESSSATGSSTSSGKDEATNVPKHEEL